MSKTLEENQAFVKALIEAVKERGENYVYEHRHCVYYFDGKPACLIGVALDKVGHTLEEISKIHTNLNLGSNSAGAMSIMGNLGYAEIVCVAAGEAQDIQDDKGTWGQALNQFIKRLNAGEEGRQYLVST